jgi:hypothetical protein
MVNPKNKQSGDRSIPSGAVRPIWNGSDDPEIKELARVDSREVYQEEEAVYNEEKRR